MEGSNVITYVPKSAASDEKYLGRNQKIGIKLFTVGIQLTRVTMYLSKYSIRTTLTRPVALRAQKRKGTISGIGRGMGGKFTAKEWN